MESRDERRRHRLEQLCKAHGGVKAVAAQAKLGWEGLDQILKRTPLPEKRDGTRSLRALGDPAAHAIEDAFDLGRGWFDWPLTAVDYKRYWALSPDDRGYVQRRLMQAIEECEGLTPSKKDRVSAKSVTQNLAPSPSRRAKTG